MDLAVEVDVIVLAQASMARVVATLEPGALSVPGEPHLGDGGARGGACLVAGQQSVTRAPL